MINHSIVNKFIKKALENLNGDWVIIGGTVLSLLGIEDRVTVDIDLISLRNNHSNAQTIKLMEIADSLGLPVETVNQSGEFYLKKIPNFMDHLELFAESRKCKIYRPNAYLFFELKLARMTETDILDCIKFMKYKEAETLSHKAKILSLIKDISKSVNSEKRERLMSLQDKIRNLI